MTNSEFLDGLEFDPGFGPYILVLGGTLEYLYADINRFKNLSQKKVKFMQYYKKILEIINNNLGFYIGCLMWASYIKTQPMQKILSNHCFGQEYDEKSNISDTQFLLQFIELFPKDMKYYLGKTYSFDENIIKLVKTYEEFLIINKGFVELEYNIDIKIPKNVKMENSELYKSQIEEIIATKDLSKFLEYLPTII